MANKSDDYKHGYSAGYAAGIRRSKPTYDDNRQLKVQVFCAALQGVLASQSNWKTGDKVITDIESHVRLANDFVATAAMSGLFK